MRLAAILRHFLIALLFVWAAFAIAVYNFTSSYSAAIQSLYTLSIVDISSRAGLAVLLAVFISYYRWGIRSRPGSKDSPGNSFLEKKAGGSNKLEILKAADYNGAYKEIFERSHDIYFKIGNGGKILSISPSAKRIFGEKYKELEGRSAESLIEGRDKFESFLEKVKKNEEIKDFIIPAKNATGGINYLSINAGITSLNGEGKLIEGIARDVTNDIKYRALINALFEISQAVNVTGSLDSLFANIDSSVGKILNSDVFIIAKNRDGGAIEIPYINYKKEALGAAGGLEFYKKLCAIIIESGNPACLTEGVISKTAGEINSPGFSPPVFFMGFPLKDGSNVIGCLALANYKKEEQFSEGAVQFLYPVAGHVAEAIIKKKNQLELEFQVNFLQNLIDTIPNPVYYKDAKTKKYLGCNKAFEDYIGAGREEIIGMDIYKIIEPESAKKFTKYDKELLEGGGLQEFESKVKARGEIKDCIFYRSCYNDSSGEVAGIVGIILDITGLKKVESQLRQAREQAELIYKLTPSCIYSFDVNGIVTSWNNRIAELTGYSPEEAIGKPCRIYPERQDWAGITQNLSDYPDIGRECEIIIKGGKKRIISKNTGLIKNSDGKVIGGIESFEDITEQKKTERELYWQAGLNSALAKLSKAIVKIPDIEEISELLLESCLNLTKSRAGFIGYFPNKGGELIISAASANLNSAAGADLAGQKIREFKGSWGWALRNKTALAINSPQTDPRAFDMETWGYKPERMAAAPALSVDELAGLIYISNSENDYDIKEIDILERMASLFAVALKRSRAEKEIRQALSKEQELNELKSRFISMVSHEYRTPLTGISLDAELLSEYGDKLTPESKIKHFNRIRESVNTMNSLLDDIISFNKSEMGKINFLPQYVDIEKLCLSVTHEIELLGKDRSHIDLSVNNGNLLGNLDEKLIRKILFNILLNAVKYSEKNSKVEFIVTVKENEAEFIIRDFGLGMDDETKERLFEPFFRGKNAATIPGTGLGLSVVKNSLDVCKGRIYYDSEPGKGATFVVTIPFHEKSSITKKQLQK